MMRYLSSRLLTHLTMASACLVAALLTSMSAEAAETVRYFGQLAYNHVSPHVPLRGIHEMPAATAAALPHYAFRYDATGRLVEIERKHPENWKQHPLTHLAPASRVVFSYQAGREERLFFDSAGKPTRNIRGVFREVYETGPDGFRTVLRFFDETGQPMESNWGIARYAWGRLNGLVIERRFDIQEAPRAISSYFPFFTTGIRYGSNGLPEACYNLTEDGRVIDSVQGIASYHDEYDAVGNHISWQYRDAQGEPALSGRYSIATKTYDASGNVIRVEYRHLDGRIVRTENFSPPTGSPGSAS